MRIAVAGGWLALLLFVLPPAANGQSLKDRLKKKAEESLSKKAEKAVDCVMGDTACIEKAQAEGKKVNVVPSKAEAKTDSANAEVKTDAAKVGTPSGAAGADALKPGEGAWANYDFKPGSQILFADDFMKDEVGDFPRRMEFVSGSMEIVEWQGGRWLRLNQDGKFIVPLPEVLPERYTMEFDISVPAGELWLYPSEEGVGEFIIFRNGLSGGVAGSNRPPTISDHIWSEAGKMFRARIMADGRYIKVYVNEKRVANVPNFAPTRSNKLLFFADGELEKPAMFGNFRIAAGGKKLYDALAAEGRVATQGIYFDTGSDRLRPESTPTLKEIGAMLAEHPELKLTIEGHTDNVGSAASNQTLSEKRAAAVRQYLIDNHQVSADRLASKGFGASKPAGPNDTPEGRQNNRRVELVKM